MNFCGFVLAFLAGAPQDAPLPPADDKVDQAIQRGVAFLRGQLPSLAQHHMKGGGAATTEELVLWTFLHAGISERDGDFRTLLDAVLAHPLERTYDVALQAMILEELDRVKYQGRIQLCAQFLVDNQCRNGQWGYGQPTQTVPDTATAGGKPEIATGAPSGVRSFEPDPPGPRAKPPVRRKLAVKKARDGPDHGDNSNSQYAALGLRACLDAGITIPREVLTLGRKAWTEGANGGASPKGGVATGGGVSSDPRAWGYTEGGKSDAAGYGSMTAGAVGALAVYDFLLDGKWSKDSVLRGGLAWLGKNFSVTQNPGSVETWHHQGSTQYHYYLYALERAAILSGNSKIGTHDWYAEGASTLLGSQKPDGSWEGSDGSNAQWDTCFAVLFLKRATRPLVASEDRRGK